MGADERLESIVHIINTRKLNKPNKYNDMQFFELLLLIVSTVYLGFNRYINKQVGTKYILALLGLSIVLQLILGGFRWQMIPAYLIWIIAIITAMRQSGHKSKIIVRALKTIGIIIILALSIILPSVLPVFELPEPRGAYAVGTELIYVKTDRDEIITKDTSDKRELLYKIWYPSEADVSALKAEKYVDKASRHGFASIYGIPSVLLNYLDLVKTYVYTDLPVADGRFPVLIFSHGYASQSTAYYAILSELASQGYVIINMNHTYESLGASFPDGRMASFDFNYASEISKESKKVNDSLSKAFDKGLNFDDGHLIIKNLMKNYYKADIQVRWAEDIISTIDLLKEWNAKGLLKDKIDFDKIGVFGHSAGGGASANVAIMDSRVKAAANMDGNAWGNLINTSLNIPFLHVSADRPAGYNDINSHIYINRSTDCFYDSKLLNSAHSNFMDIPLMIPVRSLSRAGGIDTYKGMEIVTKLLTSFFDKHLKHKTGADPLRISKEYDLLEMKVYKGDSLNTVSE
jgi:dienelactone hydrolase